MVPLSVLGKLRHAMVDQLDAQGTRQAARWIAPSPVLPELLEDLPLAMTTSPASADRCAASCTSFAVRSIRLEAALAEQAPQRMRRLPGHSPICRGGAAGACGRRRRSCSRRRAFKSRTRWASCACCRATGPTAFWCATWRRCISMPSGRAVRRRLFAQRHERTDGRVACANCGAAGDGVLRLESRAACSTWSRRAAGVAGSGRAPAHADVPHGALRVLRGAVARHEQDQLRPALRRARRCSCATASAWSIRSRPTSAAATRSSTPCRRARPKPCPQLLERGVRHFRIELLDDAPPRQIGRTICISIARCWPAVDGPPGVDRLGAPPTAWA